MIDENTPEFRTVNYRKHGILKKSINPKTSEEHWIFENSEIRTEFEEFDLINILNRLSIDGFELITSSNEEYIFRTKEDIEEEQEYYDLDENDPNET